MTKSKAAQFAIVLLCGVVVWLVYKMPVPAPPRPAPHPPEMLPIQEATPAWDGAYPFVVITMASSDKRHYVFQTSITQLKPTVRHEAPVNEFDVDLHSGLFILRQTDLFTPDSMSLVLTRTYIPWDSQSRAFGIGTTHPYDIYPTGTRFPYTYMDLNLEDGRQIHFPRISKGTDYSDAVYRHSETASEFYGAQDVWNGNGWTVDFRDGRHFLFPDAYYHKSYATGAPTEMRDGNGNRIELKRNEARILERLVSPSGRTISFKHDQANRFVEAADEAGNVRKYGYDNTGHLETVSDGERLLYRFHYEALLKERGYDPYLMTSIENSVGEVLLRNEYADSSRVSAQTLADGRIIQYDYLYGRNGHIVETTVILPDRSVRLFFFKDGIPVDKK